MDKQPDIQDKKTIALSDRVTMAAAIADSICSIASCVQTTCTSFENERVVYSVFFGIEKLSGILGDELMDIYEDAYKAEMDSERRAKEGKECEAAKSSQ